MGKKGIAWVLLLALLLTACGTADGGQTPSTAPEETSAPVITPEPTPEPLFEMGDLEILRNWNSYTENSIGMLSAYPLNDDNGILLFTDFAAATQYPVCAQEGCGHANASCEAFIPMDELNSINATFAIKRYIIGGKVYILKYYASPRKTFEEFTLERVNPDGTEREMFISFPGLVTVDSRAATDGKILLLNVSNYGDAADAAGVPIDAGESCLLKIDLSSGAVEKLRDTANLRALAAEGRELLFMDTGTEPAGVLAYAPQFEGERTLPAMPELFEKKYDSASARYRNGVYYLVEQQEDGTEKALGWRPSTGQVELSLDLPTSDSAVSYVMDGYLVGHGDDESGQEAWWYIRLGQAEVMPHPFMVDFSDHRETGRIFGTMGDMYVVGNGMHTVRISFLGGKFDRTDYAYSLIAKGDYWSGNNTATPFTMWQLGNTSLKYF